jgi:hypothetical protein
MIAVGGFAMNVGEEFKRAGFPNVSKVIDTYDFLGKHDEESPKQRTEPFTDFPRIEKETYDAALSAALDFLEQREK